jgi:hypothetical protein
MTKRQVQSLNSEALKAIVNSTNPAGDLWMQRSWARDELERRRQQIGRIEFKSAGVQRQRVQRRDDLWPVRDKHDETR